MMRGRAGIRGFLGITSAAAALAALPVQAFQLEFFDGDMTVDVRSQLNYGMSISAEKPSDDMVWGLDGLHVADADDDVATGHGGKSGNINADDSRLGYNRGPFQNQFKGLTDIRAGWGDFGAIVKVLYYYDYDVMNRSPKTIIEPHNFHTNLGSTDNNNPVDTGRRATTKVEFNDDAKKQIGRDITTKEAFLFYDGYVGDWFETGTFVDDIALNVRLGDQIIRWGQSTFAPGVNLFNPLDANRLLVPGFDIAEAAGPVGGLFVSAAITDWLTVETWAGYDFEPLQIPPGGSFMTFFDIAGAGIDEYSGQGIGFCVPFSQHQAAWDDPNGHESGLGGQCIPLNQPDFAKNRDMYGLKMTFALPFELFNQFSVYALKYNNTFPSIVVTQTGDIPNALPCEYVDDLLIAAGDNEGAQLGQGYKDLNNANPATSEGEDANCRQAAGGAVPYTLAGQDPSDFLKAGLAWIGGLNGYGFSWTGNLPFWGLAWAGEVSYKKDFPMQVAVGEIFSATTHALVTTEGAPIPLSANLSGVLGALGAPLAGGIPERLTAREIDDLTNGFLYITRNINCLDYFPNDPDDPAPGDQGMCADSQRINGTLDPNVNPDGRQGVGSSQDAGGVDGTFAHGVNPKGTPAQGYWPLDVWQANITLTKILSNMLWQDNIILLWEGVYSYTSGFDTGFNFDAPNTALIRPSEEPVAEKSGWGYRMLMLASNPQIFDTKIDLTTTLIFFHDVRGTTTTNLNLFVEDRKQAILAFDFKYGTFLTSFRYFGFWGAEGQNPFIDRDFFQVNFRWTI